MRGNEELVEILKRGGVAVIPTDTIYGIVGSALSQETVERIYKIKSRNEIKPFIVLISGAEEISKFSIRLTLEQERAISAFDQPTSFIIDCSNEKLDYLHRGQASLAFRIPKNQDLRELLTQTGPLVAPSANPEGLPPAKNIKEAENYFGNKIDLYIDGGEILGSPSRVVRLSPDAKVSIIRG